MGLRSHGVDISTGPHVLWMGGPPFLESAAAHLRTSYARGVKTLLPRGDRSVTGMGFGHSWTSDRATSVKTEDGRHVWMLPMVGEGRVPLVRTLRYGEEGRKDA